MPAYIKLTIFKSVMVSVSTSHCCVAIIFISRTLFILKKTKTLSPVNKNPSPHSASGPTAPPVPDNPYSTFGLCDFDYLLQEPHIKGVILYLSFYFIFKMLFSVLRL